MHNMQSNYRTPILFIWCGWYFCMGIRSHYKCFDRHKKKHYKEKNVVLFYTFITNSILHWLKLYLYSKWYSFFYVRFLILVKCLFVCWIRDMQVLFCCCCPHHFMCLCVYVSISLSSWPFFFPFKYLFGV